MLHAIMCASSFFTGHIWQFAAGMFFANLFDLIDKVILKREWIHKQGRFGKWFYPPVLIQLTEQETIGLNIMASLLVSFFMIGVF